MVERDGGRRTFFHHHGANALFDAASADLERSPRGSSTPGAPGLHPRMDAGRGGRGWTALLERAQAGGPAHEPRAGRPEPERLAEVVQPCLPFVDTIVINELEAGALTGIERRCPAPTARSTGPRWRRWRRA